MKVIVYFNLIVSILFTFCYFYQIVYVFIGLIKKPVKRKAVNNHRYAVIISARNESGVIGHLIDSIKQQTYPAELIDTFVVADNCTDDTADIARSAGAYVYERFNTEQVGKGYALDWLFKNINNDYTEKNYEAFIVFDADNVLDSHFIEEMNNLFDNGYRIITSYRNSKNYGENWITAGYSLWFLRESKFLNNVRMELNTSCAVSGTGFLLSAEVLKNNGGWIHHLLTEDIEFTADSIIKGEKIGYCGDAILYDEQPKSFRQSYTQRLRWAKGFYQVLIHYGLKLLTGMCRGRFACYDMLMTITPAMLLTLLLSATNLIAIPVGIIFDSVHVPLLIKSLLQTFGGFYLMFFTLGLITTITERKQIHCSTEKKVLYVFTFPLFMLTYIPIAIVALFKKVKWDPIEHSVSKSLEDIHIENNNTAV
ncbi:MAG: glycosyltransferase family 2 protein [Clostridia bacterium]|nr:glycosyltransferase family 2 protein [Clostridia bacterium]